VLNQETGRALCVDGLACNAAAKTGSFAAGPSGRSRSGRVRLNSRAMRAASSVLPPAGMASTVAAACASATPARRAAIACLCMVMLALEQLARAALMRICMKHATDAKTSAGPCSKSVRSHALCVSNISAEDAAGCMFQLFNLARVNGRSYIPEPLT